MGTLTRRAFVGHVGAAAVAAPALVSQAQDHDAFSAERFAPFVGNSFRVTADGKSWRKCVLEEAATTGPAPRSDLRKPASLMFRMVDGEPLPSGTYILHHRELGRVTLHLNPVDRDQRSEAVFN